MTKAEIIDAVYEKVGGFSKKESAEIVEAVFDTMKEVLADGFGNLASRSLAMLARYRAGKVPAGGAGTSLDASGLAAVRRYAETMDRLDLRGGAEAVIGLVGDANHYVQQSAPWTLAKQGRETDLDDVLASLARCLYRLAVLASPFIPGKAQSLWQTLGGRGEIGPTQWVSLETPPVAGMATTKPDVLFPKPAPA